MRNQSEALDWCADRDSDLWAPTNAHIVKDLTHLYSSSVVPSFQFGFQVRRNSDKAYLLDDSEKDCEVCAGLDWRDVNSNISTACLIGTQTLDGVILSVQPCSESYFFCVQDDGELSIDYLRSTAALFSSCSSFIKKHLV